MGKFRCIHPKDIFVVAMKKNMLSSASNISNILNKNTGIASGKLSITSIQQIKGEVMGVKGANINWAIRHFFKKIEERGEDCKDYLLFTFDCDQIPHKKYISAITYKFLSSKNRYQILRNRCAHLQQQPLAVACFGKGFIHVPDFGSSTRLDHP